MAPTDTTSGPRSRFRLPCPEILLPASMLMHTSGLDLGTPCSWTAGTGLSNPDSGFSDGGFRRWPRRGMHDVY